MCVGDPVGWIDIYIHNQFLGVVLAPIVPPKRLNVSSVVMCEAECTNIWLAVVSVCVHVVQIVNVYVFVFFFFLVRVSNDHWHSLAQFSFLSLWFA